MIFGEFSRPWLEQRGFDISAFLAEICAMGYDIRTLEMRRSRPWLAPDRAYVTEAQGEDLLLLPRGRVAAGPFRLG